MKNKEKIIIKGAREHNLKNIDLEIPKNKLIVFTGVSGSGKSSLAFDTIYAEGQRRYVESLAAYARQFLGIMDKPDVDTIVGLSPAISIDQKSTSHNPRSTVGTVTEIYDYLRLLFARVGHPHCPSCGQEIAEQSLDQIVSLVDHLIERTLQSNKVGRFLILSPLVRDRKGEFSQLFDNLRSKGFTRVRVDSQIFELSEELVLIKTNKHTIEAVVDRISIERSQFKKAEEKPRFRSRISDSIEQALKLSEGLAVVSVVGDASFEFPEKPKKLIDHLFSEKFACPVDNIQIPEIEPRTFSFNSPHGACPECFGIGKILTVDPELVLNPNLSIDEGGILPFAPYFHFDIWFTRIFRTAAKKNGIDTKISLGQLPKEKLNILIYGTADKEYKVEGTNRFGRWTHIWETFPGIIRELERRHSQTESELVRAEIEKRYMREKICSECRGVRLKKEALGVTIDGKSIVGVTALTIDKALEWIKRLQGPSTPFSSRERTIAELILKELASRLSFLVAVGLDYLSLDRDARTLAGGEAQRIRLASQIGSGLTGVLYVLDEPTIGLHQRDNKRLIETLKRLRDLGNTVIVVEHDREMMQNADYIVDFGPGAGKNGGEIVVTGTLQQIKRNKKSVTGQYLSGFRKIQLQSAQERLQNGELKLKGASQYNLKNIDVSFPLGKLICITGVSGSGKSTLLVETLYHTLARQFNPFHKEIAGNFKKLDGVENIDKVILIDQSPIGRTPRSNPATYTGVFTPIRQLFAQTQLSRSRGYKAGRFSFNIKGGRCEACEGQGQIKIEMQFLSDIFVTCEVCQGKRFNQETLEVDWKGKNIAAVLSMTVAEAQGFFGAIPGLSHKLQLLTNVGLDYIELGQPAPTLSGGEAQRVKLAEELSKRATGRTLYILDEPTTGLHFADLEKLLAVLRALVDKGNTVVVIEHNLDVIKNADWIIDLGPEGGEKGGEVIAVGTPKEVSRIRSSYTGQFLSKIL